MVWFSEPEPFDTEGLAMLVQQACGGELHRALRGLGVWRSRDERPGVDEYLKQQRKQYNRSPENVDDPEWQEIAGLLSAPPQAWYARISYPQADVHYDTYAARSSYFGVHAVSDSGVTHVRTFRTKKEHPWESLLPAIEPWVRPAPDDPISLTKSQFNKAGGMGLRELPAQVTRLRQLLQLPVFLNAEFYAERRTMRENEVSSTAWPLRLYSFGDGHQHFGSWGVRITPERADFAMEWVPVGIGDLSRALENLRHELE